MLEFFIYFFAFLFGYVLVYGGLSYRRFRPYYDLVRQARTAELSAPRLRYKWLEDFKSWEIIVGNTYVLFLDDKSAHFISGQTSYDVFFESPTIALNPTLLKYFLKKRGADLSVALAQADETLDA